MLWKDFLHQSTCRQSVLLSPAFQCEAFADACADSSSVGLGGYVKFPSGIKRFFQFSISGAALSSLCPFFPSDGNPQHFIAAWELLAQCSLVWTPHAMLPLAHPKLLRGKACHLPRVSVRFFASFVICSAEPAFQRTLNMSLDFSTTLLTLSVVMGTLWTWDSAMKIVSVPLGGNSLFLSSLRSPLWRLSCLSTFLLFCEWLSLGGSRWVNSEQSFGFWPTHACRR